MSERFAGRFLLLKRLGAGGMGEVFLARDLLGGTECALKRLGVGASPEFVQALRQEFAALARLRHPSVVEVRELGFAPDGTPYLVMDYVPGIPADRALPRGDWASLLWTAARVAHGLEALHAGGVVHGDVKPANVLVTPATGAEPLPRDVRLVDLGLSAVAGVGGRPFGGTPGYAAPEVLRGEAPDTRSDLYGLGATLYALVAGEPWNSPRSDHGLPPREPESAPDARSLEDAGAPAALTQLVLRLLAPSPADRPANATDVRRELERLHPAARRPLAARLDTEIVVGRAAEGARFEAALALAAKTTGRIVVEGAPGSGKSALLAQLLARAAQRGSRVWRLHVGAAPGEAALAFLRWLAAEDRDGSAGAPLSAAARESLRPGASLPGEPVRIELTEVAAKWLTAIARRSGPVVIGVDDAEALDGMSRGLLRRVMLHKSAPPSLWVWAIRGGDDEADRSLAAAGAAELWTLAPLDESSVARLIDSRLGAPAPQALVSRLSTLGGGNPGLTVDLLRAAAVSGALRETDAGLLVDEERLAQLSAGADFEQGRVSRLATFAPELIETATLLAACGPVGVDELRALDPSFDASRLSALEAAGFAREYGPGRWSIVTPALAERVLARADDDRRARCLRLAASRPDLSARERFRLNAALGRIGDALAAAEIAFAVAEDYELAEWAARVAERSSDPAPAARWHEHAAELARTAGRYGAAAKHYQLALDLEPAGAARPWRWEGLATSRLRGGDLEGAAQAIASARAETLPPSVDALVSSIEAGLHIAGGRPAESLPVADAALAKASASGDPRTVAICELTRVSGLLHVGRLTEAEDAVLRAREASDRSADEPLALRSALALHDVRHHQGRAAEMDAALAEALSRARGSGHRFLLEQLLAATSVQKMERGRWLEALEAQEEMLRVALEDDRRASAAHALTGRALAEGFLGRTDAARRHARAAVRLARRDAPGGQAAALRALAFARRVSGRLRAADRAIRRALECALRDGDAHEAAWCRIEYAQLLQRVGRWEAAAGPLAAGIAAAAEQSVEGIVLRALAGRSALRRRDGALAATRLAEGEAGVRRMPHAAYAGACVAGLRAEIALFEADDPTTDKRVLEALAAFEALPSPAEAAHASIAFASLALGRTGTLPIQAWLEPALAVLERVGDRTGERQALRLLHELLRRGSQGGRSDDDRGLIEAVSGLLRSLSDVRELARRAMEMAGRWFGAERGVLLIADAETGDPTPLAEYGAMDAEARENALGYSRRVVRQVTESGSGIVIHDALADATRSSKSMISMKLRSVMCVPLFIGGRAVGAVYLDDSRRARTFSEADRGLLEGFSHLLAIAIEKSRGQEEVERTNELLVGENQSLRHAVQARVNAEGLIGSHQRMLRVLSDVELASRSNVTVLITGESGTGKERVARLLHHKSRRRLGRFVTINCGALTETLLESELFGIDARIATGVRARRGLFQQADGGTLFLDEIAEMPMKQQVALLAVIQNREIMPVGGSRPIPVDVRIVAATHQDLRQLVREGRFREDLYYRLAVLQIDVPPLRERKSDIPELARYFLGQFAKQQERETPAMTADFMAALLQSDWPGNVRELQNYLERILAMTPHGELRPAPLPPDLDEKHHELRLSSQRKLAEVLGELERRLVLRALEDADGNQSQAARDLGVSEPTLRYRIRKLGLSPFRQNRRYRHKRR